MQWPKRSINFILENTFRPGSPWVAEVGRGAEVGIGEGGKLANCLCAWPFVSLSSGGLEMFYNKFEERILGSSLLADARHRYLRSKGTRRGHRWT